MKRQTWRFLIHFSGIAFGVYIGLITIVSVLPHFGWDVMKDSGIYGHLVLILLSIIIGLVGAIIKVGVEISFPDYETIPQETINKEDAVADAVIYQIEDYIKKDQMQSAIRLGLNISRPLWVDGAYEQRIRLGELMFKAASSTKQKDVQAQALIDDTGWTYVALKNHEEAKKNISHGLRIAEEIKNFYLMAKAQRHLGGIATQQNKFQDAENWLQSARNSAEQITDEIDRKEMLSGILYGLSELYMKNNKLSEAEETCKQSQNGFGELKDRERVAKTHSRLGQIYLLQGKSIEALSIFCEGLDVAKQANRKDEIVRNLIGIAKVYLKDGKVQDTKTHLQQAYTLADKIGLSAEKDEITNLLGKIK
ncbi:MAG: tetratricopeptide repeat protein [Desulfobacteria bacterium]